MKHTAILLVSILLATSMAQGAFSNGGRGGGDDIALEFQQALIASVQESRNHPELNKVFQEKNILKVAAEAKVLIVDDALDVQVKDLIQNSVAINIPSENKILVNRQRWNAINDSRLRSAIALHEILSLKKLEQTGYYPYSTKYLAMLGGSVATLQASLEVNRLTQIRATTPSKSPYEVLKQNFEEARELIDIMDFPDRDQLKCRQVSRLFQSTMEDTIVYRAKVLIVGHSDDGPLFPGVWDWRVYLKLRSYPGPDSPATRSWKDVILVKSSAELKQTVGSTQFIFRRNNGRISFTFNFQNTVYYGYCF